MSTANSTLRQDAKRCYQERARLWRNVTDSNQLLPHIRNFDDTSSNTHNLSDNFELVFANRVAIRQFSCVFLLKRRFKKMCFNSRGQNAFLLVHFIVFVSVLLFRQICILLLTSSAISFLIHISNLRKQIIIASFESPQLCKK